MRFSHEEKEIISAVRDEILNRLDINVDLHEYLSYEAAKFKAYYYFYRKIIQKRRPERIFLLVGYGHTPLIKAARDCGIETVEIQHGTISEYHMGYHYPGSAPGSIDYFPDKIYLWDDFWKRMCSFPLADEKLIVKGFEHLERSVARYRDVKKKKQVAVISQGALGNRLADLILENIRDLEDYTVIYKLHPGEYDRWKEYGSLVELQKKYNVTVIDDNSLPLYRILAESEYVIGVYSTVIFESYHFNCRVILADLPGIEYTRGLVAAGKADLFSGGDSLSGMLKKH